MAVLLTLNSPSLSEQDKPSLPHQITSPGYTPLKWRQKWKYGETELKILPEEKDMSQIVSNYKFLSEMLSSFLKNGVILTFAANCS